MCARRTSFTFLFPVTCVLPILLYGSVTWTLIQADWNKLDSFHVRCQRRILYISWNDFVFNDEVLRRIGLFDVVLYIVSEDWVFSVTSPDSDTMYQQTISYKSAPSRGMVSGLHRSGDAPVADHRPPGPTRSAVTRV